MTSSKNMKPAKMFAVVDAYGVVLTVAFYRRAAINDFVGNDERRPWSYWKKGGCRAIRVRVTEDSHGPR